MSALNQQALQSLDEAGKKDVLAFIEQENSKSKVQTSIHQFTDLCFKKCVASVDNNNGQLSAQEDSCLSNCVNRFLDTNIKVVQGLQAAQTQ